MSATKETIELVAALRQGDSTAQKTFLKQFTTRIFQLVVNMTNNAADAEELTQDALLRGLRNIHQYDPLQATLLTWLRRIAYRLTLNHLSRQRPVTIPLDSVPEALLATEPDDFFPATNSGFRDNSSHDDSTTTPSAGFVFGGPSTEIDLLHSALGHLPPDELTLVNLFYYEDLPLQEIAYIIEAPPGTIATRLHRIRKKLHYLIQKLHQQ